MCSPTERTPTRAWVVAFIAAVSLLAYGLFCICWTIWMGTGTWNLNRTIGWGYDITNFVCGLVLVMPEHLFLQFGCCLGKDGVQVLIEQLKR
ncbi:MAG: hypothetical protein IPO85_10810 [Saprospiraceae bacterium]|uniref:Uncharacterized protein n=1 Tax=Candidatus Defluviibacterium haderslevense TaxID=2981993 RepID=A0A9D7SAP4_9BACT|nr:hypothetical protein [Candidatus Defluviibacterium haderslevense]